MHLRKYISQKSTIALYNNYDMKILQFSQFVISDF